MTGGIVSEHGFEPKLPALLKRYLGRVLPPAGSMPRQLRLTQMGEMWQRPGGRALGFTAVEELAVGEVAFSWRARFPIAPLLALHVHDWYRAGEGALEARLLGVPVMRSHGVDVVKGEAMRYLAELPWVPQAFVANAQLEWRELDDATVEVGTVVASSRVAVRFHFDAAGDIIAASADARPRAVGKRVVDTPFRGEFAAYEVLADVRVPTSAEVSWELPEGRFTYFRGQLTALAIEE